MAIKRFKPFNHQPAKRSRGLSSNQVYKCPDTGKEVIVPLEEVEQMHLITWAGHIEKAIPDIVLLHAVPNGELRTGATAARLKAQGVKPGVADLSWPVANYHHHGLYLEIKRTHFGKQAKWGTLSDHQRQFASRVERQGFCYRVGRGWREAADIIEKYFKGDTRLPGLNYSEIDPANGWKIIDTNPRKSHGSKKEKGNG